MSSEKTEQYIVIMHEVRNMNKLRFKKIYIF